MYRLSARNFNPMAAMSGKITIAEVEQLVEPGDLDPNHIHTPGVYVHRVLPLTAEQVAAQSRRRAAEGQRELDPRADGRTSGG